MRKMIAFAMSAAACVALASPALADHHMEAANPAVDPALKAALAGAARGDDGVRDDQRHPADVLTFFGVKPGMTVVDYMPASGWYTKILVPYLGASGTYIGLNPEIDPAVTGYFAALRDYKDKLPAQVADEFKVSGATVIGANVNQLPEELHGTADRVLIFREIHNMRRFSWLYDSLKDMHALLKDDGYIGVVQHRAKANAPASYTDGSKGYQREKDVIALFEAHGFDLVATSEINANPKDPADWEGGVWTLPPVYGGATEETRPQLAEIGESDRMTLLFRKRP